MRMIDADAVRLKFQQIFDIYRETIDAVKCRPGAVEGAIKLCTQYLDEQPTIEAEPVRHGKLLEGETFNDQHCSVCGQVFRDDISFIIQPDETGCHMPKRCPECGCYWDGGADNG